jgi:hypothetical protein
MEDNKSINFEEIATRRMKELVTTKITEAVLQILSSEDMLIASALGLDVEVLINETASHVIKELTKEG